MSPARTTAGSVSPQRQPPTSQIAPPGPPGTIFVTVATTGPLDDTTTSLKDELSDGANMEIRARALTERMALALQAALLVRHSPNATSDAFCASRLGLRWIGAYGTLPVDTDFHTIIDRISDAM